jgi:tetratricopeptide (TPR) repeat protein
MADEAPRRIPTEDVPHLEAREYRRLLRRTTLRRVPVGKALEHLGRLIDAAFDRRELEGFAHALNLAGEFSNRRLTPQQQITLHYFVGNIWSSIKFLKRAGTPDSWSWEQEEIEYEITNFRLALNHPDFNNTEEYRKCQILTNLGNLLDNVGRFVEAQEYWRRALQIMPNFGMGLGNRGSGLFVYARAIPRRHDSIAMLDAAQTMVDAALRSRMIHSAAREYFSKQKSQIEGLLRLNASAKHTFDFYKSLGPGETERRYRRWCLSNCLFLNYLNDVDETAWASADNVMLPTITRPIGEPLQFEGLYNELKQGFVSARYLCFDAMPPKRVHFSDKRVVLYDTLDYPSYSIAVEKLKAAYRIAYSIFDKIAFFLNSYLRLGIKEYQVTFRTIWYDNRRRDKGLRSEFTNRHNWALRGLFWLGKDLFEDADGFRKAIEPDAQELKIIRDHIEHKYLKVVQFEPPPFLTDPFRDTLAFKISRGDLHAKTLRVLKMARAALLYLSVAIYWEEVRRNTERPRNQPVGEFHLRTVDDRVKI